jgi:hypothetical protein
MLVFFHLNILGVRVSRDALMCAPQKVEMPGGKVEIYSFYRFIMMPHRVSS